MDLPRQHHAAGPNCIGCAELAPHLRAVEVSLAHTRSHDRNDAASWRVRSRLPLASRLRNENWLAFSSAVTLNFVSTTRWRESHTSHTSAASTALGDSADPEHINSGRIRRGRSSSIHLGSGELAERGDRLPWRGRAIIASPVISEVFRFHPSPPWPQRDSPWSAAGILPIASQSAGADRNGDHPWIAR